MAKAKHRRARRPLDSHRGPITPSLLRSLGFDIVYFRPGGRICAERGRYVFYFKADLDREKLKHMLRSSRA